MRLFGLLTIACALFAAPPDAPPARVDKALRGRVAAFFQAHVDGKPRLAEAVVAEDSKDLFYAIPKPRYYSFEIASIQYSDKFTKATVVANCEEEVTIMMGKRQRMKMPQTSTWKLEKGLWSWYVDLKAKRQTPFGPAAPPTLAGAAPAASPFESAPRPTVEQVTGKVKADKSEVRFDPAAASTQIVTIANGMPGWIQLTLQLPRLDLPGFEGKLDRADVPLGGEAKLTLRYEPKGKLEATEAMVHIVVQPTDQVIPIRVFFSAPAK